MKLTDEALRNLFESGLSRAAEDHKIHVVPGVVESLVAKFRAAEARKKVDLGIGYAHMVMRSFVADYLRAVQRRANKVARDHERSVAMARQAEVNEVADRLLKSAVDQFDLLASPDRLSKLTKKQRDGVAMLRLLVVDKKSFDDPAFTGLTRANAWQRVCRARQWLKKQAVSAGLSEVVRVFCDLPISPLGGLAEESFRDYVESLVP